MVINAFIMNISNLAENSMCRLDLSLEKTTQLSSFKKGFYFILNISLGSKCLGVIKTIHWENSFPLIIELSSHIRASVYFRNLVKDPNELDNLKGKLKEGEFIQCYTLFGNEEVGKSEDRLKASLFPEAEIKVEENFAAGDLVVCRCMKAKSGQGISVQLSEKQVGHIDITEISDEFGANPLSSIAKKGVFAARVLEIPSPKEGQKPSYKLSSRKSLCDAKCWKLLHSGTTLEFQQQFEYITEESDMRSKIIKL